MLQKHHYINLQEMEIGLYILGLSPHQHNRYQQDGGTENWKHNNKNSIKG